jgi:hypothetical protein
MSGHGGHKSGHGGYHKSGHGGHYNLVFETTRLLEQLQFLPMLWNPRRELDTSLDAIYAFGKSYNLSAYKTTGLVTYE